MKEKAIIKSLLILILFCLSTATGYANFVGNGSSAAYVNIRTSSDCVAAEIVPNEFIRFFVVKAAIYLLDSQVEYIKFLHTLELSEINPSILDDCREGQQQPDEFDFNNFLNNALQKMDHSITNYDELLNHLDNHTYNCMMRDRLACYDYDALFLRILGGDTPSAPDLLFEEIRSLLITCNIKLFYIQLLKKTKEIESQLRKLQSEIANETTAVTGYDNLSKMWRINQNYTDTIRYGQYASEVFMDILNSLE
ncbi:MAG: hypothetical protein GY757_23960 [bacterium]|nr:hypothetical protein [bacterium]